MVGEKSEIAIDSCLAATPIKTQTLLKVCNYKLVQRSVKIRFIICKSISPLLPCLFPHCIFSIVANIDKANGHLFFLSLDAFEIYGCCYWSFKSPRRKVFSRRDIMVKRKDTRQTCILKFENALIKEKTRSWEYRGILTGWEFKSCYKEDNITGNGNEYRTKLTF